MQLMYIFAPKAPNNMQLQLNMYMSDGFQNPRSKIYKHFLCLAVFRRQLFIQKFNMNRTQCLAYFPNT